MKNGRGGSLSLVLVGPGEVSVSWVNNSRAVVSDTDTAGSSHISIISARLFGHVCASSWTTNSCSLSRVSSSVYISSKLPCSPCKWLDRQTMRRAATQDQSAGVQGVRSAVWAVGNVWCNGRRVS
jgi:hypothetical protein